MAGGTVKILGGCAETTSARAIVMATTVTARQCPGGFVMVVAVAHAVPEPRTQQARPKRGHIMENRRARLVPHDIQRGAQAGACWRWCGVETNSVVHINRRNICRTASRPIVWRRSSTDPKHAWPAQTGWPLDTMRTRGCDVDSQGRNTVAATACQRRNIGAFVAHRRLRSTEFDTGATSTRPQTGRGANQGRRRSDLDRGRGQ